MAVLDRGNSDIAPLQRRVGAAFQKVNARDTGETQQVLHSEHQGGLDETIDHQPMAARINIDPPLMMSLKMETAGRDHAEQVLQRRESDTGLISLRQAGTLSANNVRLKWGGHAIGVSGHRLTQGATPLRDVHNIGVIAGAEIGRNQGGSRSGERAPQKPAARFIDAVSMDIIDEFWGQKGLWRQTKLAILLLLVCHTAHSP